MFIRFFLAALLSATPIAAATGDILGASVLTNGWQMDVWIEGLATNQTFTMGVTTNGLPSSPRVVLTVPSPRFLSNGSAVVSNRVIWSPFATRMAYPNDAFKETRVSGSDVIVRLSLSDYLHPEDLAVGNATCNFSAGFYGASLAATGVAVTNQSTLVYPRVAMQTWDWPGDSVVSNTIPLQVSVAHHYVTNGQMIAAAAFIVTDGTTTQTNFVTNMTILVPPDSNVSDQAPVIGYSRDFPTAAFINGATLTCNVILYPHYGTTNALVRTDDGVNTGLTPNYAPISFVLDRTGAYGRHDARVATTGNDATGVAVVSSAYNPGAPPAAFLTMKGAAAAIAASNNVVYARNDVSGGTVHMDAGSYSAFGTGSVGSTPAAYITYKPSSGVARSSVIISGATGNADISDRVKLENLTITTTSNNTFDGIGKLWVHNCNINSATGSPFGVNTLVFWTHNTFTQMGQGLRPTSTGFISSPALVRGNHIIAFASGSAGQGVIYKFVGNHSEYEEIQLRNKVTGQSSPVSQAPFFAFNKLNKCVADAVVLMYTYDSAIQTPVMMQNLIEGIDGLQALVETFSQTAITNSILNMFDANNTLTGERCFISYNDQDPPVVKYYLHAFRKGNVAQHYAYKYDNNISPFSGIRVGNWSDANGVLHGWNMNATFWSPNNFKQDFPGPNSLQPPSGSIPLVFVDDKSFQNAGATAGDGDYHPTSASLWRTNALDIILPWDLDGYPRRIGGAAGAFELTQDYYVEKTGNDANPGTEALPFLTVQKAANVMIAGDRARIGAGWFDENVTTVSSGTAELPITFYSRYGNTNNPSFMTMVKSFRVQDTYQVLSGLHLVRGGADLNKAIVRIENSDTTGDGSNLVITNCTIRDTPLVVSTNASFGTNSMTITDGVFTNFVTGDLVNLGADSYHWHTNHDRALIVLSNSVDNMTIYFNNFLTNDSGSGYWATLYAGTGNDGYKGVLIVQGSGSAAATNILIVDCVISNVFGNNVEFNGNPGHHTLTNTTFAGMKGRYAWRLNSSNTRIENCLVYEGRNIIWFTQYELDNIVHPPGGDWFDYQANIMDAQASTNVISTNNLIKRVWFENLDNQAGLFTGHNFGQNGVTLESNVWVGVQAQGGGAMDNLVWKNNTAYRSAFDSATEKTLFMAFGSVSGNTNQTGFVYTNNAHIDVGYHAASTFSAEGGITMVTNDMSGYVATNNFITGPETAGWPTKSGIQAHTGMTYNGGNPLFIDPLNPRGADGLPFTADDGLRSLPSASLAINNIGALQAVTLTTNFPTAIYQVYLPSPGWKDATGTNYNTNWVNTNPGLRGGDIRPWDTPEALGNVPCTVLFSFTNVVNGYSLTNYFGQVHFGFDPGDGSGVLPTKTAWRQHTYMETGEFTAVLWVTNISGNVDSFTNAYRVLPKTITNVVYYVNSATGNNADSGLTPDLAWATLAKAVTNVNPGTYVSVKGDFNEVPDMTGPDGVATNRIYFIGHGARVNGLNWRKPYYTWDGFHIDGDGLAANDEAVFVYPAADGTIISHCTFGPWTNDIFSVFFDNTGLSGNPMDGQLNCVISNNWFNGASHIATTIRGSNNVVQYNMFNDGNGQVDLIRPFGRFIYFEWNYVTNICPVSENHADVFQSFGPQALGSTNDYIWLQDFHLRNNIILGSRMQICQLEAYLNTNVTYITNNFIYNNFFNVNAAANVDMDGFKWYNNTFYRCTTNGGSVIVFGGPKGNAYGSEIIGNAFVECGSNPASTSQGWYLRMEAQSITNYSLVADYNFVCGTGGAAKSTSPPNGWGASGGNPLNTWEAHGINGGDPMFVNTSTFDLRLQVGSPLSGTATVISLFSTDIYGQERGSTWDIGAAQGSFSGPPPPPADGTAASITGNASLTGNVSIR